jgi:hypothetical protein
MDLVFGIFSDSSWTAFGRLSECSRSCAWVAQKPLEVALELPGEPKIDPWRSLNRAKSVPRGSQEQPRAARSTQERPRTSQERPKSVPRGSQERPKSAQERHKSAQKDPRRLQEASGATKNEPRAGKNASQEAFGSEIALKTRKP